MPPAWRERLPRRERQVWGAVCFLNSASVSLSLPWLSSLPAPVTPWVSGGGKAPVFAKLMICLCAKLTGGWTSTQTLLMASRPLCWRPRSPALAPCRPPPLLTPTLAGRAPQSMPEPLAPSAGPWGLRNKTWCFPPAAQLVPLGRSSLLGSLLGNLSGPRAAHSGVWRESSSPAFLGWPALPRGTSVHCFPEAGWKEVSRALWPAEDLTAGQRTPDVGTPDLGLLFKVGRGALGGQYWPSSDQASCAEPSHRLALRVPEGWGGRLGFTPKPDKRRSLLVPLCERSGGFNDC